MNTPQRIGFLGLGQMGLPMAVCLAQAGFELAIYDLNQQAQDSLAGQFKVLSAQSPAQVAQNSDLVITMLPDGKAVAKVVLGGEGQEGMAAAMAPGAILVDMSSSDPMGTRELGSALADRGLLMLDAPVSGGVAKARTGQLAIMAGGDPELLERCRPVLEAMGGQIFHSGPLGSGHAVKALNNMLSAAGLIAAAEVLLVGRGFGVDPLVMTQIINASTGRNNSTENKFPQHVLSRSFASGFSLDLMLKDLSTAMDLARSLGVPALFSSACRELWAAAQAGLGKGQDHTAVVRWFEELAGQELRAGEE